MSAFFFFFPLPTFREPSNCGMGGLKCHLRIFKHSGARGIGSIMRACEPELGFVMLCTSYTCIGGPGKCWLCAGIVRCNMFHLVVPTDV